MQYLASDEKVPDKDIDRMHVRDNLKAVQLSRKKINMLESTLLHWRTKLRHKQAAAAAASLQPVTLRKRRQNIKSEANWPLFYYRWGGMVRSVAGSCLQCFSNVRGMTRLILVVCVARYAAGICVVLLWWKAWLDNLLHFSENMVVVTARIFRGCSW